MRALAPAFLVALLSLLPLHPASGQSTDKRPYGLKSGSSFVTGCFGPCLCPIVEQPMQGTFNLREAGFDPLYTYYDVLDVRWRLPNSTQSVTILGSGTYRIGGEVALQHQMVLDLSVNGNPVQHFDSGLIPGGGSFPDIDIRVSLHQMQACIDTVLHVVASPAVASSVEGGISVESGIRAVTPNPFRDQAQLILSTASSGTVEVRIFDLTGRVVRVLSSGRWMPSGVHPLGWNGKADDGRDCPAGLYFVRATIGSQHFLTRVVRVK